jgi:beta-phosphoglucomutase-like phosphatase (HAD superfamily)
MTNSLDHGGRMAALIDIDGTLVDSTYLHASAWSRAIRACGFDVPTSRAHRLIGMRGERLLEELLGKRNAASVAERAIDEHAQRFATVRDQVVPLPHARELLERLVARDVVVVLVSSAERDEVGYYGAAGCRGPCLGIHLGGRRLPVQARPGTDPDRAHAVGM